MADKPLLILANSLPLLASVVVALILVAAGLFGAIEHQDFGTSLYWAITTITTVGYGDVSPHTGWGRTVGVVLMLSTTFFVIPCIVARVLSVLIEDKNAWTDSEQRELFRELADIKRRLGEHCSDYED
jgi:voltage-gated potassium channel